MNILKSALVVLVALLTMVQTSSVNAEGMDLVRHFDVEKEMRITFDWNGHREVWIGHNIGKGHRLAVVDFQGAKISNTKFSFGVVGARVIDTRYYADSGYVYAKFALDGDTRRSDGLSFDVVFNYNVTVYDGTHAGNARSTY